MKRYRRLEAGEMIQEGDYFDGQNLPQALIEEQAVPVIECSERHHKVGNIVEYSSQEDGVWREVKRPERLVRKYRLVKNTEPVRLFDWFKMQHSFDSDKQWPAPDKQYNEGWVQIVPGDFNEHWTETHNPTNRSQFVFARFVDCVPLKKS